jgi:hypothetical protein
MLELLTVIALELLATLLELSMTLELDTLSELTLLDTTAIELLLTTGLPEQAQAEIATPRINNFLTIQKRSQ